jgi:signal transduction histidine kinase
MRVSYNEAGEVIAEVSDDGPGVPPDMLSRLAEPFFRACPARSDTDASVGLGLSIAQAIVESHGGQLIFSNRAPRGFSARIVLPARTTVLLPAADIAANFNTTRERRREKADH